MKISFRGKDRALWLLMSVQPHPKLLQLIYWVIEEANSAEYEEIVWTSFHRPKGPGDSGVHDTIPCRAWDFFVVGMSTGSARKFEEHVNEKWDYGKVNSKTGKPFKVLIWHDTGRGLHFHGQVRDETRRV